MSRVKSDVYIRSHYPVSESEWLSCCQSCSYATFFQTPMWVKAFEQWSAGKMKADTRIIEFSDGKKVIFPLAIKKIAWLKIGISMPAATYGGWITQDYLELKHYIALLDFVRKKYKNLFLLENPYDPLLATINIKSAKNIGTSSVDLRPGIETVIKTSKYYHRKNVKTAEKNGVQIEVAEDFSKWLEYFRVYEESISRWKEKKVFLGVKYDISLFEILYRLAPSLRRLWVAHIEGRIIAGILCFYWNRHVVAWNGAGLSSFFHCRPNNLLYQHAIEHACKEGYHWFDCNPSGGLEGVSNFKQGLGTKELQTRIIDQRTFTRKLVQIIRSH